MVSQKHEGLFLCVPGIDLCQCSKVLHLLVFLVKLVILAAQEGLVVGSIPVHKNENVLSFRMCDCSSF